MYRFQMRSLSLLSPAFCSPDAMRRRMYRPQHAPRQSRPLRSSSSPPAHLELRRHCQASLPVDLGFRVGGKIIERSVEVGSLTNKGDVIARLDPKDFELALAAQEADLAASKVTWTKRRRAGTFPRSLPRRARRASRTRPRQSAAAEARSRVERAERNVELARNQLARLFDAFVGQRWHRHVLAGGSGAGRCRRSAHRPRRAQRCN